MTRQEIRNLLLEIAERLEDARTHACTGFHCAVCCPDKNAEELRIAIDELGLLTDAGIV